MSLFDRAQRAAQDISEALAVGAQPLATPQAPVTPQQGLAPPVTQGMPPQGALGQPNPSQGALGAMPAVRPAMSPLQNIPSFRLPPLAATLQGPQGMQGHPAMTKPVGFAKGGLAVFRGDRR